MTTFKALLGKERRVQSFILGGLLGAVGLDSNVSAS